MSYTTAAIYAVVIVALLYAYYRELSRIERKRTGEHERLGAERDLVRTHLIRSTSMLLTLRYRRDFAGLPHPFEPDIDLVEREATAVLLVTGSDVPEACRVSTADLVERRRLVSRNLFPTRASRMDEKQEPSSDI
jgi:hypothetical protein